MKILLGSNDERRATAYLGERGLGAGAGAGAGDGRGGGIGLPLDVVGRVAWSRVIGLDPDISPPEIRSTMTDRVFSWSSCCMARPDMPAALKSATLGTLCVRLTQLCADYAQNCFESAQSCDYHTQMLSRRITFADLATVARIDRHRLRNLLKDITEFKARPSSQRVANEYTRHDLTVVAVLCELDRMGLRKDAIAGWVPQIQQVLLGPRPIAATLQIFLATASGKVRIVDGPHQEGAGIVVDLKSVLDEVDTHCVGLDATRDSQRELEFGPQGLSMGAISQKPAVRGKSSL